MSGMGNLDKFFLGRRPTWTPHRHGGESFNNMSHFSSPPQDQIRKSSRGYALPKHPSAIQNQQLSAIRIGMERKREQCPLPILRFFLASSFGAPRRPYPNEFVWGGGVRISRTLPAGTKTKKKRERERLQRRRARRRIPHAKVKRERHTWSREREKK